MSETQKQKDIFPPWNFGEWHAVDDRVRGGASQSHLEPAVVDSSSSEKGKKVARFWGHLDIDTLGGAGFASQRYRFGPEALHLPPLQYRGITLTIRDDRSILQGGGSQANNFTLVLKNILSTKPPSKPKTPPQPEPASLSYEASFTPSSALGSAKGETINIPFDDLKAVYRGREVPTDDPRWKPFHPEKIYELSLMCRSDFGDQKGDFSVIIESITGWKKDDRAASASSIFDFVGTMWTGFWIWLISFVKGEGRVHLGDEEKDPLI